MAALQLGKIPVRVRVEVKEASELKVGLKDIKGKLLPPKGIVVKKVTHSSLPTKTEYIVPEGQKYYAHLSKVVNEVDMSDFLTKAKEKI